ncbi:hypothetical protein AB0G86_41075 [Streptomyces scabiei]|uniref:hypothetical protein n=1 Tax=Streptomyces scabiei TaxID=1930 RepID=UPI0033EC9994
MTGDPGTVAAVWVESTWCGIWFETLTADGQVHIDGRPPIGEPRYYEGEDDPDFNPVCHCPRTPRQFCLACADCGQCPGPHIWPPARI